MREYKVSLTWVLAIVAATALVFSSVSAMTPLGGQMQALAVTIAGDVVCSQCVGTNGDGTNDIKDASVTSAKIASSAVTNSKLASSAVTNSKLASNAVTSSKIAFGGVTSSDVAQSFMKRVLLQDDSAGHAAGWDPGFSISLWHIFDSAVTENSIILVDVDNNESVTGYDPSIRCASGNIPSSTPGSFILTCDTAPTEGSRLHYVVING